MESNRDPIDRAAFRDNAMTTDEQLATANRDLQEWQDTLAEIDRRQNLLTAEHQADGAQRADAALALARGRAEAQAELQSLAARAAERGAMLSALGEARRRALDQIERHEQLIARLQRLQACEGELARLNGFRAAGEGLDAAAADLARAVGALSAVGDKIDAEFLAEALARAGLTAALDRCGMQVPRPKPVPPRVENLTDGRRRYLAADGPMTATQLLVEKVLVPAQRSVEYARREVASVSPAMQAAE